MKTLPPEALDALFDNGEDIGAYLDPSSAVKINAPQRISLDIPAQMLKNLDREATRIGVARQALIKVWLAERLDIISS